MNTLLEKMFEYSKTQPKKLVIVDKKKATDYLTFAKCVYGFCLYLQSAGFTKGDCIIVRSSHSMEYLAAQMGMQLAGVNFVPVEKIAPDERVQEIIDDTCAKWFMSDKESKVTVPFVSLSIVSEKMLEGDIPYGDIIFPDPEDTAEILYSTGTTGKSKGIVMSHRANLSLAGNICTGLEMKKDNVELIPGPLNHSNALRRYYGNIQNGSTVVLLDGVIFVNQLYQMLDQYRVTAIALVPAMLAIIFKLSGDKLAEGPVGLCTNWVL